jgi:hypothetical protein
MISIGYIYQPTSVILNVLQSTQTQLKFERVIKNASQSKTFIKLSN